MTRFLSGFLLLTFFALAQYPPAARYPCYRSGPIEVDGRLDEPSWKSAPLSNAFVDIVTGEPAWWDTRVALLWDDRYLYVGFTIPENNVVATLTARDSKIYLDNDVELFIAGKDAYYEFEINALDTIYEVFWIWQDALKEGGPYRPPDWDISQSSVSKLEGIGGHKHPRGLRYGFLDWDFPGLRHAVHVDGTLNNDKDADTGWSVELALPWRGFRLMADGRALPPKSGDEWRIDCSRFQHYTRDGERVKRAAGWTWSRHGHYDSHIPETFTHVTFSGRVVGK